MNLLKPLLVVLLLTGIAGNTHAQYVKIGSGDNGGSNTFGPAYSTTSAPAWSRYMYIFPASALGNLKHGDSISNIRFYREGTATASSGNTDMKIYLRMTTRDRFPGGNLLWSQELASFTVVKVYDSDPSSAFGNKEGWVNLAFNVNKFRVDTLYGKNLQLLVEYTQNATPTAVINWRWDDRFSVSGYQMGQCRYGRGLAINPRDTLRDSSDAHPFIILNYPRFDTDAAIAAAYSLGKIPVPLGNPDSLKILVRNTGKKTLSNYRVYMKSQGKFNKLDSGMISNLGPGDEKFFTIRPLEPTNAGMDTIRVWPKTDSNPLGDTATTYRLATDLIYSYRNVNQPPASGGIGFNGSTGDFVAKFFSSVPKAVNQVSVNFGFGGRPFRIGIWDAKGKNGAPGKLLWQSATKTSTAGTYILDVDTPVTVNGNFFVGVRQTGTSNVAFGYQMEEPVRPGTFLYTSPLGDTNWVDFHPDAPFRFLIEPRIQADHDVAPVTWVSPKDTLDLATVKMMAPKVIISNFGANDEKVCFQTVCRIRRFGTLLYTSTRCDSLNRKQKKTISFDSTFLPTDIRNHDVEVITTLYNDQMRDNDTLRTKFFVAKYKDMGPDMAFSPGYGSTFELNRDTVFSTVRVQNFGFDQQSNVPVRCQIKRGTKVFFTETKNVTLKSEGTQILSFTAWPASDSGNFILEVISFSSRDNNRLNDTLRIPFTVQKSNDVAVTRINFPANGSSLKISGSPVYPRATYENFGLLNQAFPFPVYFKIFRNGNLVYLDSAMRTSYLTYVDSFSFTKGFVPNIKGPYKALCYTRLSSDQYRKNDSMWINFNVGRAVDLSPVSSVFPKQNDSFELLSGPHAPICNITNYGFQRYTASSPVLIQIRHNGNLVYNSVKSVVCDSSKTVQLTFDASFIPTLTGIYQAEVVTNCIDDGEKKNDTLRYSFTAYIGKNTRVRNISFPTGDTFLIDTARISPVVQIENLGRNTITNPFPISFAVRDLSGKTLYINTLMDTLAVKQRKQIKFTNAFVPLAGGRYTLLAWTGYIDDQKKSDDTAWSDFFILNYTDLALDSPALAPGNPTVYLPYTAYTPGVRASNSGSQPEGPFRIAAEISGPSGNVIWKDTLNGSSLNAGKSLRLNAGKSFTPYQNGIYRLKYQLLYAVDRRSINDTVSMYFTVGWPTGIQGIQKSGNIQIYPNPASTSITLSGMETGSMIRITDISGRVLNVLSASGKTKQVSLDQMASGIYFVRVQESGRETSFKLQVLR